MARIQTSEALGKVLPNAVNMRLPTPQYDVSAATAVDRAAIADAERQSSNARKLKGFGDEVAGFGAAIAKQQEDDENYEVEKRFMDFDLQQDLRLDQMKREVQGDPKDFAGGFMAGYSESARALFKEVPDRLKPKVDQMLTQRASRYEENATKWEREKRDEYHIGDLNTQLDEKFVSDTQARPEAFKDNIARGVSLIDQSKLSGEAKYRLKKEYAQRVEDTAVRARVERGEDPVVILRDLRRLPSAALGSSDGTRTSEAGFQSIRDDESFFGTAYRDGPDGYSVGYGTYGVKPGTKVTREEAEELMKNEVRGIEAELARKITVPVNQNQWDSMVNFFYNLGTGKGRLDEVAEMINSGRANEVPNWMRQFVKARNKRTKEYERLPGLVDRRDRNAQKFAEPSDDMVDIKAMPEALKPLEGVLEEPNFDMSRQPIVKNDDGSVSTIATISIGRDGREILIPTVSEDGRKLSEKEAIAEYDRTGRHLGVYSGPDAATEAAKRFHEMEERRVADQSAVYRHLSHEQRSRLENIVTVAGRAKILQDIADDVERIKLGGLEAARVDDEGRFALERAEGILTPNQIERAKIQLREANLEHKAISPLSEMTETQALGHLEQFLPNAEADDESFASARRVTAKAETAWKRITELREKDPARAVNQSPEVRAVFDEINASAGPDGAPTLDPVKANGMLVEARMEAQKRLGIRDAKPITRKQGLDLLNMPDPSTMSEREFRKRLEEGRDRAIARYGDKWARPVFEAAVGFIVGNQREREIAAPVISRMARGEKVTQQDVRKSDDLRRASESDRLFPSPSDDAPLSNRQGTTVPRAEANDKKAWPTPPERAIKALRDGKDPGATHEAFARKYGPDNLARALNGEKTPGKKGEK
jgi:GH24 family phage-related lysozyme (muramidase)